MKDMLNFTKKIKIFRFPLDMKKFEKKINLKFL